MTRGPDDVPPSDEERWDGRPWLARAVRTTVFVGPLALSLLVTSAATRLFPAPRALAPHVLWLLGLLLLATVTVWWTDRLLRRLMPLAALLQMSVLFPGQAPTRFSVARQAGATRHLEELVARARESDAQTGPSSLPAASSRWLVRSALMTRRPAATPSASASSPT